LKEGFPLRRVPNGNQVSARMVNGYHGPAKEQCHTATAVCLPYDKPKEEIGRIKTVAWSVTTIFKNVGMARDEMQIEKTLFFRFGSWLFCYQVNRNIQRLRDCG